MDKDIMHPSRIHDWARGSVAYMLLRVFVACNEQALAEEEELRKLHRQVGYKPPEKRDGDEAA